MKKTGAKEDPVMEIEKDIAVSSLINKFEGATMTESYKRLGEKQVASCLEGQRKQVKLSGKLTRRSSSVTSTCSCRIGVFEGALDLH
jgi:hypothetical protein